MHMMNQTTAKHWKTTPVPVHIAYCNFKHFKFAIQNSQIAIYKKLYCYAMQILFWLLSFAMQNFQTKSFPVDTKIIYTCFSIIYSNLYPPPPQHQKLEHPDDLWSEGRNCNINYPGREVSQHFTDQVVYDKIYLSSFLGFIKGKVQHWYFETCNLFNRYRYRYRIFVACTYPPCWVLKARIQKHRAKPPSVSR